MEIIVKNYSHYNRALGKYIKSKRHYQNEMAKQGMVSYEKGRKLAEKAKKEKPYKISDKALAIINSTHPDSKGKVKLSDRAIDGMKDLGCSFESQWCPKHYREAGGFDNAT